MFYEALWGFLGFIGLGSGGFTGLYRAVYGFMAIKLGLKVLGF